MKELSIEEKAKLYDEAIIRGSRLWESDMITRENYEYIFPEVKESEDELTWLKRFIKEEIDCLSFDIRDSEDRVKLKNLQRSLAWLEKKPSLLTKEKALKNSPFVEQKPADKKGMNLVEEEMTPFQKEVFCIIDTTIEEEQGLKQVCDKLFALASNDIKQKPAWSEEDEENLNWFEKFFRAESVIAGGRDIPQDKYLWLKSLKERYTWKPSDLQIEALNRAMYHVEDDVATQIAKLIGDLKKLREE